MKRTIASCALAMLVVAPTVGDDWPQWRGPARDGVSQETGLLQEWPTEGPKLAWAATEIGSGYSSPSIAAGRVYIQTTRGEEEFATALDEKSGQQIWSVAIGKVGKNLGPQYPGTRSTPTVDGQRVYCLASGGELVCLQASDGQAIWQKHLHDDFDGQPGAWAYSESVLIDGDVLVCTPGGDTAALAALDKGTGEVVWKSVVDGKNGAEYASIVILDDGRQKQYVQFVRQGLVGVSADTGDLLWRYDDTADPGANIMTPIVQGSRIFSAGSRTGGGMIEVVAKGGEFAADQIYFDKSLGASIGGAVLVDGYVYGTSRRAMFCVDFVSGEIKWNERALGGASICYADGRLYVRGHTKAEVALVEPSPEGYREVGRFEQPQRSETRAWPHPVVANGRLYLRDEDVLLCFDVSSSSVSGD